MPTMARPCPACGQPTEPDDFRQTARGVICQSCAFQVALEQTRMQSGGGGAIAPMAARSSGATDSFALGLLAGLFGGCIGFGIVYLLNLGPQTKKGAGLGFGIGLVLGTLLMMMRRSAPAAAE